MEEGRRERARGMSNIEYPMSNYEVKGLNIESAVRRTGSGLDKMERIELDL